MTATYTVTREGILPDGRGYQDLHWHEELQLTRVECGDLDIRVDGIDYTLHQGEAILNLSMTKTNTCSLSLIKKWQMRNGSDAIRESIPHT